MITCRLQSCKRRPGFGRSPSTTPHRTKASRGRSTTAGRVHLQSGSRKLRRLGTRLERSRTLGPSNSAISGSVFPVPTQLAQTTWRWRTLVGTSSPTPPLSMPLTIHNRSFMDRLRLHRRPQLPRLQVHQLRQQRLLVLQPRPRPQRRSGCGRVRDVRVGLGR